MKRIMPAAAAAIAALFALQATAADDKADREPPRPRVLYIFAPDLNSKELQKEYPVLQRAEDDLEDSDIFLVYVVGDRSVKLPPPDARVAQASELRKLYHVDADAFRMVLIGKDGWQKMRWNEPVDVHQVLLHAADMPTGHKNDDQDQHK